MRIRPVVGLLILAAMVASSLMWAAAADAKAPRQHRARVGKHFAKIVRACSTPKRNQMGCLALRRVETTAAAAGAEPYVVRASYEVGPAGGYTPQDLWTAYGLGDASTLQAPGGIGSTQTVAIVDAYDSPTVEADLAVFSNQYGLPACTTANGCFKKVNQRGGSTMPAPAGTSGWGIEIALDVQAVHAMCPNCKIVLVEADSPGSPLAAAVEQAIAQGATEVSLSFESPEFPNDAYRQQFNHPGVVITAAAGDAGYHSWDRGRTLASIPAALPEVVAVGGTSLQLNSDGTRASERVWNNDTGPGAMGGTGSSGGGCSIFYTATAWQALVPGYSNAGCAGKRLNSDVSILADPYTGFDVYDSSSGGWQTIGGTSLSAPLISAMYALAGGAQGVDYPSKTLYAGFAAAPNSLNDVTAGGNGYCDGGICTPPHVTDDCGGTRECAAAVGFDGPTGVGTPHGLVSFAPVIASFTMPARAFAGDPVTVDASASTALADSGAITSYSWNWGDGTSVVTATPVTTHTFGTDVYTVSLTASTASAKSITSTARIVTVQPPVNTAPPTIAGSAVDLQTLSIAHGAWINTPTSFQYQWRRCDSGGANCTNIQGGTRQSYRLQDADVGHTLLATETAVNAGGTSVAISATSPTAIVAPAPATDISPFGHVLGSPFPTGSHPVEVAISSNGIVAVTNQGADTVSTFTTDADGLLTPAPGSPYSLGDASSVAVGASFSPDGTRLAIAGGGSLHLLSVSATGALSAGASIPLGGHGPGLSTGTISFSPDGTLIVTAESASSSVRVYAVSLTGGLSETATSPVSIPSGGPSQAKFSPTGHLLAVSTIYHDRVYMFSVANDGALTPAPGSPYQAGADPQAAMGLGFSPGGSWLAVATNVGVTMFSVEADGALTLVSGSPFTNLLAQTVEFSASGLLGMGVDVDGHFAVEFASLSSSGVPSVVGSSTIFPWSDGTAGNIPTFAFAPSGGLLVATNPARQQVTGLMQGASKPPIVNTTPVTGSSVHARTATLDGTVNPRGHATTYRFVLGTSAAYDRAPTDTTSAGSGTVAVAATAALTNLSPSTTYHYALEATNVDGTTRGQDRTFTTPALAPPAVTASSVLADSVTTTGATLTGTIDSKGQATTYQFRYGSAFVYGNLTPLTAAGTGEELFATAAITGLTPATTYHYALVTTNADGVTIGPDQVFTTRPKPPIVATSLPVAGSVTHSRATVTGTVDPRGLATDVRVVFGTSSTYTDATAWTAAGSDDVVNVSLSISGLAPDTFYHYSVEARNADGTTQGGDLFFMTGPPRPGVATSSVVAGSVTVSTATLSGTVDPMGNTTTYRFLYGTSSTYTDQTTSASAGSGTTVVDVTAPISGLAPSTLYHYAIEATSSDGTTRGVDRTFTSRAALPVVTTSPTAVSVMTNRATLSGTVNPMGALTSYRFVLGTTTAYELAPGYPTAAGSGTQAVDAVTYLFDLTPGTTYHYAIEATSSGGTARGLDATFTTAALPTPPMVTTSPVVAGSLTSTSATLAGTVNPTGTATTYRFVYGTSTAYASTPTGSVSAGSGTTGVGVTAPVSGLLPSTTYHYALEASNATGTTRGLDQTFTTADAKPPIVTTLTAGSITTSGASLAGTVNPNGQSTTYRFAYGTSAAYSDQTAITTAGSGTSVAGVSATISGLAPGTTYHYTIRATNADGTTGGTDQTFTTAALTPPVVATSPPVAGSVTYAAATLAGTVNPNGLATTYHFLYGTTAAYSSGSTASVSVGAGASPISVTAAISGLNQSTTYHYAIEATNADGTTRGADRTFTTAAAPPTATTSPIDTATVTSSGATLAGTVDPAGTATSYRFLYGTTSAYELSSTPYTAAGAGSTPVNVSAPVTGLAPSTTYHYVLEATNIAATTRGVDRTFTTAAAPVPAPPSVTTSVVVTGSVTTSGATMAGTVNPNGLATTYRFRYGTSVSYDRTTADVATGSGTTAVAVTAPTAALAPGTLFHYAIEATNADGTTLGQDQTFTTTVAPVPTPPIVATSAVVPGSITNSGATMAGTVNPNGRATTYRFRYGASTAYGAATQAVLAGSGTSAVAVTAQTSAVSPGTLYHYAIEATNADGTSLGQDQTFTTTAPTVLVPPIVVTSSVVVGSVTASGATLAGTVNPHGKATTYRFSYGTSTQYDNVTGAVSTGSGASNVDVTSAITGLAAGTTYHYAIKASNADGEAVGADQTFTTPAAPPIVTTLPALAESVTASGATLTGTVDTRGRFTTYRFVYGTSSAYGSQTDPVFTDGTAPATASLFGLSPATTYHYAVEATNNQGTAIGSDRTFTTGAAAVAPTIPAVTGGFVPPMLVATTPVVTPPSTTPPPTTAPEPATPAQIVKSLAALPRPSGKSATAGSILRSGGWTYPYSCVGAGSLKIEWRAGTTVVAVGTAPCAQAGPVKVRIKLSPKGKKLLKAARKSVSLKVNASFGTSSLTTPLVLRH